MPALRTVLIASVIAVAAFICAFYALLDPGKPSNLEFKQSGSREAAGDILRQWGAAGKVGVARRNLAVDWLFIAVYSTLWISAGLYFAHRTDAILRLPALFFTGVGMAGAMCDVCENLCLWFMLHGNESALAPRICAKAMPINVGCFFAALLYFAVACMTNLLTARR